jgi:Mrp family chromosome partitioning ATPase
VALGLAALDDALVDIDLATGQPREVQPVSETGHTTAAGDTGCIHVLITGPLPPDPGEFVGTRKLREVLKDLHDRYDIVVIDSPPLLRVGDAMTLSSCVDGLLVLTRLNTIKRPMLRELARLLEAAPTTKLGYVVTGSQRQAGYPGSYGYGYGYGDAYYARVPESTEREESSDPSGNGRRGVAREETV